MKKINNRILKSVLSYILVFSFVLPYLIDAPLAFAASPGVPYESSIIGETIPQEFVEKEAPARNYETLIKNNGVTRSDDGSQVLSVEAVDGERFSAQELKMLFGEAIPEISAKNALKLKEEADNQAAIDRFGYSEAAVVEGKQLHGSTEQFQFELDGFAVSNEVIELPQDSKASILALIAHGYTNSQAFAAAISAPLLGLTVEDLADVKASEILAEAETDEADYYIMGDEKQPEEIDENEEYQALAIKMGVPYSVIADYMERKTESSEDLESRFDSAREEAYFSTDVDLKELPMYEATATGAKAAASEDFSYAPEKILSQPFSYDAMGDVDINLNTGSHTIEAVDLSIPGINGLDLNIVRRFQSEYAETAYPWSYLDTDYSGRACIGAGYKPFIFEGIDENGNDILSEVSNLAKYTLASPLEDEDEKGTFQLVDQYYLMLFTANAYEAAAAYKESLNEVAILTYIRGNTSNTEVLVFKPIIVGIEPNFSRACINDTIDYDHYIDEFGLGYGWSLGFSAIETYLGDIDADDKYRLITSNGEKYEIDFRGSRGYLIGYELKDMTLYESGSGYPGASYTLEHKNGTKEYFDAKGRNIAIVDRYENAITLSYTLTSSGAVSAINIVDTLGHNIVYANENIPFDPDNYETIDGSAGEAEYNIKWTLKLDGTTIKTYYVFDDRAYDGGFKLGAVEDDQSDYVRYSTYGHNSDFNSYVSTPSTNDETIDSYEIGNIYYPNGLEIDISYSALTERLGYAGYIEYRAIKTYTQFYVDAEEKDIKNYEKKYTFDDYSSLNLMLYGSDDYARNYNTEVIVRQTKDTDGPTYIWEAYRTLYTFNAETHNKSAEKLYRRLAIQNAEISDAGDITWEELYAGRDFTPKLVQSTSYSYNSYDLPSRINVSHYDWGASTAGMTEDHRYTYDSKGNVLTETLPNGQVIRSTYNSTYSIPLTQTYYQDANTKIVNQNTLTTDGKAIAQSTTTVNDQLKGKTAYTYDSSGQLTNSKAYSDAVSYTEMEYVYNSEAQPVEIVTKGVKDSAGSLVSGSSGYAAGELAVKTAYNDRGWITSQTDAQDNVTSIEYDYKGRITKSTNPDGTFATYAYDDVNRKATYKNELGTVLVYEYDFLGNLTGIYDVAGAQYFSQAKYNSLNQKIEEIGHSSGEDTTAYYYYDTSGRFIETGTTDTSGANTSKTTYDYTYTNNLYKTTQTAHGDTAAPSQVTTSYKDYMNNVVKQGRLLSGTEYLDTFTYDYLGNTLTEKTAYSSSLGDDFTYRYTYDHAGRALTTQDAVGSTTAAAYDWLGNCLSTTDPSGSTALYTYDVLGRLLKQRQPFSESGGTVYYATALTDYDQNGNVAEKKTSNNAPGSADSWSKIAYTYNNRGALTTVATYDGGAPEGYTQYYYNPLGNVMRMYTGLSAPLTISGPDSVTGTDTSYAVTKYSYDRFSNLLTTTDSLNQVESYTYDINGNVLTKTDRNGSVTAYTYDDLGRATSVSVTTTDSSGDATLTLAYTLIGQVRSESNGSATTTYAYDALGRMTSEIDGGNLRTYGYNIGNSRTSFTLTVGGAQQMNTGYTYDAMNRLTRVADGAVTATYGYDQNGNRSYVQYNNGLREDYSYNNSNLLTRLVNKNSSGAVLSQYDYTYTLDGNQVSKTEPGGKVTAYAYDDLGRLQNEAVSGGSTAAQTYAYAYDDFSNRASLTATGAEGYSTAYTYDLNNRLLTEVKTSSEASDTSLYHYDPNGNQVGKTTEQLASGSASESAAINAGIAGGEVSRYNGFNQLVETTVGDVTASYAYAPSGLRTSKTVGGTTTKFVLDGSNVALEMQGSGVTGRYVRGFGLVQSTIGGEASYYLYNGHGDVVQLTNASGAVTKSYDYDAFGNEKTPDTTDTNPFRYSGEYYDAETGNYYLRARYYDPTIGRFSQEDSFKDGLNWYAYCGNNPIMFIDPSGHFGENTKLSYGIEKNPDTVKLQQRLVELGYLNMPDDMMLGVFDNTTLTAVNNYKEDNGLWNFGEYRGVVGITTWKHMGIATDSFYESGTYIGTSDAYSRTTYSIVDGPSLNRGIAIGSVGAGIISTGGDYQYCDWNIDALTADASAGLSLDYIGFQAGARLVSAGVGINIPLPFTDKTIYLGVEADLMGVGVNSYYENGRIKLGASLVVGGSIILGIE